MSRTSWKVKKRYNNKVYSRISVDLPKDIVAEFKMKCIKEGVSQASIIKEFITNWIK